MPELIAALEKIEAGEEFSFEQRRRKRISEVLEQAKKEAPARQSVIPVERVKDSRPSLSSLPEGLTLAPSEFTVQYADFEDFSVKMSQFLHVLQTEIERVREFMESTTQQV